MADYLIGAGVVLALIALWKVSSGIRQAKARLVQCAALAAELDAEGAESLAMDCFETAVWQFVDPVASGVSNVEVDYSIEMAVACSNRINQLAGKPYGPGYRMALRTTIVRAVKDRADKIRAGQLA